MIEVFFSLLYSFIPIGILILIIYAIVKAASINVNTTLVRGIIVTLVVFSAIPAGLITTYYFPINVLNFGPDAVFGTRLIIGSVMIISAIILKNKTQKYFLGIFGLVVVLMQIPYIYNAYGTIGGLATVAVAFVGLIVGTIWLTLRNKHE